MSGVGKGKLSRAEIEELEADILLLLKENTRRVRAQDTTGSVHGKGVRARLEFLTEQGETIKQAVAPEEAEAVSAIQFLADIGQLLHEKWGESYE